MLYFYVLDQISISYRAQQKTNAFNNHEKRLRAFFYSKIINGSVKINDSNLSTPLLSFFSQLDKCFSGNGFAKKRIEGWHLAFTGIKILQIEIED